jgi:hypothetical protein
MCLGSVVLVSQYGRATTGKIRGFLDSALRAPLGMTVLEGAHLE